MTAREEILGRIRRNLPQSSELPDLKEDWIRYDDPVAQFRSVLEGVGGQCHEVASLDEAIRVIETLEPFTSAQQVVSYLPGLENRGITPDVEDPHDLADVDLAVLPGELAVAENAAVWVSDEVVAQRVLYFLTQHLVLFVPAKRLLHNMHEAYGEIEVGSTRFGAFVSGPSKTADIEQSLVIGAHGARSLHVFLVADL